MERQESHRVSSQLEPLFDLTFVVAVAKPQRVRRGLIMPSMHEPEVNGPAQRPRSNAWISAVSRVPAIQAPRAGTSEPSDSRALKYEAVGRQ